MTVFDDVTQLTPAQFDDVRERVALPPRPEAVALLIEETRREFFHLPQRYGAARLDRVAFSYNLCCDHIRFRATFFAPHFERNWIVRPSDAMRLARVLGLQGMQWCHQLWREAIERQQQREQMIELRNRVEAAAIAGIDPARPRDDRTFITPLACTNAYSTATAMTMENVQRAVRLLNERPNRFNPQPGPQAELFNNDFAAFGNATFRLDETRRRQYLEGNFDAAPPEPRAQLKAEARAETLLREWLSPAQAEQYHRYGWFEVRGCETGSLYRITRGYSFNVAKLDRNGKCVAKLCFAPEGGLALGDIMLAQKLALETDEGAALNVANVNLEMYPPPRYVYDNPAIGLRPGAVNWVRPGRLPQPAPPEPIVVDSRSWTGLD